MAAKHTQEKKAFASAQKVRQELLGQVEKCDSSADFEKLEVKFKKLKAPVVALTAYHSRQITTLNLQITQAMTVKAEQIALAQKLAELEAQKLAELETAKMAELEAARLVELETARLAELETAKVLNLLVNDVEKEAQGSPVDKTPVLDRSAVVVSNDDYSEVPVAKNNPNKEKHLVAVRDQIEIVRKKAEYFDLKYKETKAPRYLAAYTAAVNLVDQVEELTDLYAADKIKLPAFKAQAKKLFAETNKDVKELHKHRGWKEILVNFLALLVGSVFFVAAAVYAGSFFVFKPETNAAKKVNALGNAVSRVEEDDELELGLSAGTSIACH